MRMKIDVFAPLPPEVDVTYFDFGYGKFGLCCWTYDGYDGEIEWINTMHFCTEPKYPEPTAFRYWFQPGVIYTVTPSIKIRSDLNGATVAGIFLNPATGEGFPMALF